MTQLEPETSINFVWKQKTKQKNINDKKKIVDKYRLWERETNGKKKINQQKRKQPMMNALFFIS